MRLNTTWQVYHKLGDINDTYTFIAKNGEMLVGWDEEISKSSKRLETVPRNGSFCDGLEKFNVKWINKTRYLILPVKKNGNLNFLTNPDNLPPGLKKVADYVQFEKTIGNLM